MTDRYELERSAEPFSASFTSVIHALKIAERRTSRGALDRADSNVASDSASGGAIALAWWKTSIPAIDWNLPAQRKPRRNRGSFVAFVVLLIFGAGLWTAAITPSPPRPSQPIR